MKKTERAHYHHGDLRAALIDRAACVIDESGLEALTLRGLARDLGVSHGAPNRHFKNRLELLSALAADGYQRITEATLSAADEVKSDDPWIRLNAMGRGYMRWALQHRAKFRAITHPDVGRNASSELLDAIHAFQDTLRNQVRLTQLTGRHPETPIDALTLYSNAVPFGVATFLTDEVFEKMMGSDEFDRVIEQVMELVVPIAARGSIPQSI